MAAVDHLVTITRSGSTLSVDNPSKQVKPNDRLSFTCLDDFTVFFKNARNPHDADKRVVSEEGGNTTKPLKIRFLKAGELGKPGNILTGDTFRYGVAVLRPDTGVILTLDPDIIVLDSGGGGGNSKPKSGKSKTKAKKPAKRR